VSQSATPKPEGLATRPVAAHARTKEEKLSLLKLVGAITGFTGVAALLGPDLLTGARTDVWAELAILAAALCYALTMIFARRMRGLP
jgi:drug/metabolite transporter (DMT)-like permease